MKTYKIIAIGRVQGVGFRYFTFSIAKKYKLNGWVRNLPDRSVEIYIQGNTDRIENLKKYLLKGNMFIKVDRLVEETLDVEELYDFKIRY